MDLKKFFSAVEDSLLAQFHRAGFITHSGDKGENREQILRDFLTQHLPSKYGITNGQIITKEGKQSHSADIIIYDKLHCPILYAEHTAILPIEGVYGIIEVKSDLSKPEFLDAARKIESFKRLSPRDLSIIQTREYVTLHRPSRPFGIILGYECKGNSLDSLTQNWQELNRSIHDVDYFVNMVGVLGEGILNFEMLNLGLGEKHIIFSTDEFVDLVLSEKEKEAKGEPGGNILTRIINENLDSKTFGRFFVYLLIMLERIKLGVPDIGRYLDPTLPLIIHRES